MKENIEPNEIIQTRKVNIEVIERMEHVLGRLKTALNEKQQPAKVKGSFIYAALFVKYVSQFIESNDLMASIEKDMVDSGLKAFEEKP